MVADKSWNQRFNLLRFFDSELFPSVQGCRVQEQMECLENKLLYFIFGQPAGYCFKPVLVELVGDKCWPWWFHRSSHGHFSTISMWRYRSLHLDWSSGTSFNFSMVSIKKKHWPIFYHLCFLHFLAPSHKSFFSNFPQ